MILERAFMILERASERAQKALERTEGPGAHQHNGRLAVT